MVNKFYLVPSFFFFRPMRFFFNLNIYFMKTAKLPVFGNIVYNTDYTLRCLEYICLVSSSLRRHRLSLRVCPLAS